MASGKFVGVNALTLKVEPQFSVKFDTQVFVVVDILEYGAVEMDHREDGHGRAAKRK